MKQLFDLCKKYPAVTVRMQYDYYLQGTRYTFINTVTHKAWSIVIPDIMYEQALFRANVAENDICEKAIQNLCLAVRHTAIKLEGLFLLYGEINIIDGHKTVFPKDCKMTIPESIPLFLNDNCLNKPLGTVKVIREDKGLKFVADISLEEDGIIVTADLLPVTGLYNIFHTHQEKDIQIIDEASLWGVTFAMTPRNKSYLAKVIDINRKQYE